ncbi:hypothetical protein GCM10009868_16950 [Terrabacter aerolatus]|uniref:Uncharacterized protein n=1 Tax=Terrabacter aerolatus TaxID=422442 RepID=A0A512D222_9MICO|nr:hypothetical protein TAE01_23270 [Terrabacter aerolatus]
MPEPSVWVPPLHEMADPPSRKTTVPVGVPFPAVTVAVRVTVCPTTDGVADEARVVVVDTAARTVTAALVALVAVHPERIATTV